jgi:pyruvate carboxylase
MRNGTHTATTHERERVGAPSSNREAPVRKVLVANRSEIAVRVMRAAHEMDLLTVGVYTPEDRGALHRTKAGEAYQLGEPGHPVRGYLDIAALLEVAERSGADALHPGYGFLSESAALADACAAAGVTFVGPPADVLRLTGDKVTARQAAVAAGLPVLRASDPLPDGEGALDAAEGVGFPLFVKAAAGGGGRGLRLVRTPEELADAARSASREAAAAFGDGTIFLEQAVERPRHIEVQVLGDTHGSVVHLFERDCSVQRRHQKVVELAPAPDLPEATRTGLHEAALAFARSVGYVNAGTVEFLVGADGAFTFMEMNPRIQVEHTVTEEVTGVDLVGAQLRVAAGESLADLGLTQDRLSVRGCAVQCRITTEDPANGFRPDTGTIATYQSPGGPGVRLDGAVYAGAEITPFFDSLLVKLTSRAPDLRTAANRTRRALREFRVRGVKTNVEFLYRLMEDEDFLSGAVPTSFLAEHPHLTDAPAVTDRTTRMLGALADATVNGLQRPPRPLLDPVAKLPDLPAAPPVQGSRRLLDEVGPERWAQALRERTSLAVTDTTLRDAHQSLLATRLRTTDVLGAAPATAKLLPGLLSLEAWGGATYDVALRFLHEDPWQRLASLREARPTSACRCCCAAATPSATRPTPTGVVQVFVAEAAATGVDVFRVFDALNDLEQMRPGARRRARAGKVAEGTLCYTGDLSNPGERSTRSTTTCASPSSSSRPVRTCSPSRTWPAAAPRRLPTARPCAAQLASTCRCTCTRTTRPAGSSRRCSPRAPPASTRSTGPRADVGRHQPAEHVGARRRDRPHRALDRAVADALSALEPYWEAVRDLYAPFEAGCARRPAPSTATRSPAASSPTCASRRSRSGSVTAGRTCRSCTPSPTSCSASRSR